MPMPRAEAFDREAVPASTIATTPLMVDRSGFAAKRLKRLRYQQLENGDVLGTLVAEALSLAAPKVAVTSRCGGWPAHGMNGGAVTVAVDPLLYFMAESTSWRKWRTSPWIGQDAKSPRPQIVCPSMRLPTSSNMSISSWPALPAAIRWSRPQACQNFAPVVLV